MKFGIVQFPGSNCDRDCLHVLHEILKQPTVTLWHQDPDLKKCDCVILPGGFSYGDYLRTGAMAARSPIMESVKTFAKKGGLVFGICNGFQILCEAGLLPGVLMRNTNLRFICKNVSLKVENSQTRFTQTYSPNSVVQMPIAHMEGHYYIDEEGRQRLQKNRQIVFRYQGENPNGSVDAIAGVINEEGNVLGMMPHPERVSEALLGGVDGLKLFEGLCRN